MVTAGVAASHASEEAIQARGVTIDRWIELCEIDLQGGEAPSLQAPLPPEALPWRESLWDDFFALWGWVCLRCLVAPGPAPARNKPWSLVSGN